MRQKLLVVLMAAMLVLAGCSGATGPGESGEPSDGTSGEATGTISFYISDQQNAIDDFEHLNVTVTMVGFHRANAEDGDENETAVTETTETNGNETENEDDAEGDEREGWVEFEVNETTVDLTELQGENATLVEQFEVPNGTYDKVFIYISDVNGTLKDGSQPDVMLPSNKLQLNKQFTVGDGDEVSFVYDITVIKRGQSGSYNIKPVAGESGANQPIREVEDEDEDGEQADESGQGQQGQQNRGDSEETATATETESSIGQIDFYVSDQRNAIEDFQHLNVTITEVGLQRGGESGNWTSYDVENSTVDLTELQGANATMLAQLDVKAGTYTKVFIHVSEVNGTLTDGTTTDVKLPSERLQLTKEFEIGANETVDFVYDVTVVKRGQAGSYNIKPIVSESGTDQPIREIGNQSEDKRDDERGDEKETTDGTAEADLNATFVGDISAGENATVRVTANGTAVANATVTYDGTEYATDMNGEVTFTVADDAEEVDIVVTYDDEEIKISEPVQSDGGD